MSIGVGIYLASYLQNRSGQLTQKNDSLTDRPGLYSTSESEFQTLFHTEGFDKVPFSEWKMVFDALSEDLNQGSMSELQNIPEPNQKKSTPERHAESGKKALMNWMKSDRFLMMSKIRYPLTDELHSPISSRILNTNMDEIGHSVEESSKEWMELFGQAQESAEFMSYASENFESRASKHRKSKIPTAGSSALVRGQYDSYKFFSVSNVEKMLKNNYRPDNAIRILDLAL